ncbi:Tether containing UBX domain for GLUT4, partial [Podochytrium sp. JEL0797]
MSSSLMIEVEGTFPPKKISIKTTPAMSLNQVLSSALEKLGNKNPVSYGLRYNKTLLDLSLSVRFANLPSGAKLVLTPTAQPAQAPPPTTSPSPSSAPHATSSTPSVPPAPSTTTPPTPGLVTIALQIQEGPRIIQKLSPLTTLWSLLKQIESQDPSLNITSNLIPPPLPATNSNLPKPLQALSEATKKLAQKNQDLVYAFPLLILSNREFGTFALLKETTLEACGLRNGGNALVRLLWKVEAGVGWENVKGEVEAEWERVVLSAPKAAAVRPVVVKKAVVVERDVSPMEMDTPLPVAAGSGKVEDQHEAVKLEHGEFDRDLKVFAAPHEDADAGPMNIQLPDSFFILSPTELKLAYLSSKSATKHLTDAPLMTKSMRDREDALRAAKFPKTMVRVRFPDRVTIQAQFLSTESVGALYEVVGKEIVRGGRAFVLYVSPPLQDL